MKPSHFPCCSSDDDDDDDDDDMGCGAGGAASVGVEDLGLALVDAKKD